MFGIGTNNPAIQDRRLCFILHAPTTQLRPAIGICCTYVELSDMHAMSAAITRPHSPQTTSAAEFTRSACHPIPENPDDDNQHEKAVPERIPKDVLHVVTAMPAS